MELLGSDGEPTNRIRARQGQAILNTQVELPALKGQFHGFSLFKIVQHCGHDTVLFKSFSALHEYKGQTLYVFFIFS